MEITGLNGKNKNLILNIAVVIFACLIAYNAIYKKQLKDMQALKNKTNTEIKKNEVLENIAGLEKRMDAYKNLLKQKDVGLVIDTITNIAKDSGVKILSLRPGLQERKADYIKTPFVLSVSAKNYHALARFINKLENSQDVYIVENVDISPQGQTKELSVNLNVGYIAYKN